MIRISDTEIFQKRKSTSVTSEFCIEKITINNIKKKRNDCFSFHNLNLLIALKTPNLFGNF